MESDLNLVALRNELMSITLLGPIRRRHKWLEGYLGCCYKPQIKKVFHHSVFVLWVYQR